ncbi:MAG: biopolymer transport protein ExbD [Flavobacteriales bacterium]|jgi:biopolymer transport protein ExbD
MPEVHSRRTRRMERHHKKNKSSGLNLVSLMDIFTILVFFLLVNSSSSPQLISNKDLTLPISTAIKSPKETLVIAITEKHILLQGRMVAEVSEALKNPDETILGLKDELKFLSGDGKIEAGQGRKITVMGDKDISYELIRKILATCREVNYTNVAFAATQVAQ